MNKVKIHRYNETWNVIQKYKIETFDDGIKGTSLGYDVAHVAGRFVKSFDGFDEAIRWIEENLPYNIKGQGL